MMEYVFNNVSGLQAHNFIKGRLNTGFFLGNLWNF